MKNGKVEEKILQVLYREKHEKFIEILPLFPKISKSVLLRSLNILQEKGFIEFDHHTLHTLAVRLTHRGVIFCECKTDVHFQKSETYHEKSQRWIEFGILGTAFSLLIFSIAFVSAPQPIQNIFQANITENNADSKINELLKAHLSKENKNIDDYRVTTEIDGDTRKKLLLRCPIEDLACTMSPHLYIFEMNENEKWELSSEELLYE